MAKLPKKSENLSFILQTRDLKYHPYLEFLKCQTLFAHIILEYNLFGRGNCGKFDTGTFPTRRTKLYIPMMRKP